MSNSRVGEVAIRLRLPADLESRAAELRDVVQRELVPQVLEGLERRVHQRLGNDVVLRLRSLPFACSIVAGALADEDLAERLAAEISSAVMSMIDRLSPPERLRPRGEQIAFFADEGHADAAQLADAADGRASWFHRDDTASTWARVLDGGSPSLAAVLGWLARMDRVDAVLSSPAAPPPDTLFSVLPRESWSAASGRVVDRIVRHIVTADAWRRAAADHAAATSPRSPSVSPAVEQPFVGTGDRAPHARDLAPASAATVAGAAYSPAATAASPPGAADEPVLAAPVVNAPVAPLSAATELPSTHMLCAETEYAGLFYLAGRVLEIDLAERLWAAGLPEGDVLVHVAAALLGRDDVACRWFGGAFSEPPLTPDVAAWAETELREQVQHALGIRLVRFGVETTPDELDLQLGRLAAELPAVTSLPGTLARTVSRAAAALATITAARLGEPPSAALIRTVLTRLGTLTLDPTTLTVAIPIAHLALAHRRAGLDHDPGQLPWLRRRLTITFTGTSEL